ncbi:N-terminal half of MaoC dehydratase [Pseudonocardia ammonioxydans]|uniref:N-terminal half of MaoC dehydratase n=1 Tax=Pseudonocardia ammonioxydans TaxID=260086 RepID=A0A1I5HJI9_PSUAM|nr:MaoC family dehydratase N-terminal domain-containing protein [Pseudonocardia ammonioxydans]SFO48096.1 N-terminal half of MaoC dehydratase [Pseudonocardia ammonioxydans]
MPIDPDRALAWAIEPVTTQVERGRLAFFATATGQTDPVYSDLDAAKAAGHPDLPVPPTFFFSLELAAPDPFGYLTALGVDLRRVLHGEQAFTYHAPVHAGDTVTLTPRIVGCFTKKGGTLEFLVKRTDVTRDGQPVAEAVTTIVVQNPEAAR